MAGLNMGWHSCHLRTALRCYRDSSCLADPTCSPCLGACRGRGREPAAPAGHDAAASSSTSTGGERRARSRFLFVLVESAHCDIKSFMSVLPGCWWWCCCCLYPQSRAPSKGRKAPRQEPAVAVCPLSAPTPPPPSLVAVPCVQSRAFKALDECMASLAVGDPPRGPRPLPFSSGSTPSASEVPGAGAGQDWSAAGTQSGRERGVVGVCRLSRRRRRGRTSHG